MNYTRKATVFGKDEGEKDERAEQVSEGIHTSPACVDNKGQANETSETLEEPFSRFSCTLFALVGRCPALALLDPSRRGLALRRACASVSVHYFLCRSPRCPRQEPSGALMFCFSVAGTYKHYSFPMNLLSRWPRANGLVVSAFDIGVVPGWRARVVAGMCRTARRSQLENALDSLGVRGAAERSWQRWYPDFSPGGERPSPACC